MKYRRIERIKDAKDGKGGREKDKCDDDGDDHYMLLDFFKHNNLRGDEAGMIEKKQK